MLPFFEEEMKRIEESIGTIGRAYGGTSPSSLTPSTVRRNSWPEPPRWRDPTPQDRRSKAQARLRILERAPQRIVVVWMRLIGSACGRLGF
jgi:hypothetical protein